MRIEKVLWWSAIACAVLLLPFGWTAKTMRHHDGGAEIQGWGWQNVATLAGIVALVALWAALFTRPRVPVAVLGALFAAFAFAVAAAEAARTWIDLTKEAANPNLYGYGPGVEYTLIPATGMNRVVGIAVIGAVCALVLLGTWLRPGTER